ncbi:hypothetical protein [Yoonia sp.]|uniref:hypothetical protein n=1 Tax=Yoonia sp. TaxID=2212373 RepID=UPI00358F33BF
MALAAATIAVATALLGAVQSAPVIGLAGLGVIALCASLGWRWISDRPRDNASGE